MGLAESERRAGALGPARRPGPGVQRGAAQSRGSRRCPEPPGEPSRPASGRRHGRFPRRGRSSPASRTRWPLRRRQGPERRSPFRGLILALARGAGSALSAPPPPPRSRSRGRPGAAGWGARPEVSEPGLRRALCRAGWARGARTPTPWRGPANLTRAGGARRPWPWLRAAPRARARPASPGRLGAGLGTGPREVAWRAPRPRESPGWGREGGGRAARGSPEP